MFSLILRLFKFGLTMNKRKHTITISLAISLVVLFSLRSSFADELNLYLKNISADSVENVLLVDKSQQRLLVLKSNAPQNTQAIDTFRVTTGKIGGNKEKEGDRKTPEGIYTIISSIPGKQLPAMYGPMAFVLDYPNRVDKIQHHNGSNIWIHGRDEEIIGWQTEGCVSLENNKLLELSNYITLQKTPVIIIDSLYHNGHSSAAYEKFNLSDSLIINWVDFWEKGEIERFGQLFSEHFKTRSWRNKRLYLNNKKQLETIYPWKDVTATKIWILQSDYEALIHFQQDYLCPTFFSHGNKQLHLIWADSCWQIINEDFTATQPQVTISSAVEIFLNKWRNDWKSSDIDQYISHYDSSFSSRTYASRKEWFAYKKGVFAKSQNIDIKISEIAISSTDPYQWTVTFRQDYKSGNYHDQGKKTILIKGHPQTPECFKIFSENWESLK